ncbi:MAG: hypothetical protein HRT41_12560 [Campylobacteraceae bacterium]|nr:hypothetical protein [Campylobacteraceae bacterium]
MCSVESNNIKILIVDDNFNNIVEMRKGLEYFDIDPLNIYPDKSKLRSFSNKIREYATNNQSSNIFRELKTIIKDKKIDLLFLDLNLTSDENPKETTGEEIIELFMNSNEQFLINIPIIIVSMYSKEEIREGSPKLVPFLHIKKEDNGFDRERFIEHIKNSKLDEYWKLLIQNYRKIRESIKYKQDLEYIKYKLETLNYEDKLNQVIETMNTINEKSLEVNEKLQTIELFSKSIVKVLPELANKANISKVINSLKEDGLKDILGAEFPDDLRNSIYKKLKGIVNKKGEDSVKDLYGEIKDVVKDYISDGANIETGDNIVEKTGKLTGYLYGKTVELLTTGKV